MKATDFLIGIILTAGIAVHAPIAAQDSTKYHIADNNMVKNDTNPKYFTKPPIVFTNLASTVYYVDAKKLKNIDKLEAADKLEDLKLALQDYISNFSGENFGQDYELMWKLAQLYQKQGELENAKWLYRILLRHSESHIQKIGQFYDELTVNDKDYYVPISFYYELVDFRRQVDSLIPPKGVFLNMGENLNSEYEDYGPSLSADNETLFFGTKRNRRTIKGVEHINEDIYFSTKDENGEWAEAQPLEGINSQFNDGAPNLTRDGNTLYFVRCESPDGLGRCDLYVANKQPDGTWGNVQNLGPNVNTEHWDSHPALSHSEDTLYFVSDRPGGFGANDIYFTYKNKHGQWMPAQNMGPIINTRGNDLSPFYHPVHHVFYFSSDNQVLNFGNFDIYKTRWSGTQWEEPKNIGPLVNGWGDEHFFTIDAESENLYYARSEKGDMKQVDLYSFPLPMEAQPEAYTVFKGSIVDSVTGNPFAGIVSVIDLDNGIEVAPKFVRPDGSFEFDLINNNKYLLVIQGEDFFRVEKHIDLNGDTTMTFGVPAIETVKIQFASIEFASNSAEITLGMQEDLTKLMDYLIDNPKLQLNISGHTDSRGDAEKNIYLSHLRAVAIKEFLTKNGGIDPARVTAQGYGNTMPIIKEELTDEDRKINRRVEFEIIKPSDLNQHQADQDY